MSSLIAGGLGGFDRHQFAAELKQFTAEDMAAAALEHHEQETARADHRPVVTTRLACGRTCLEVNGVIVAVEGDICRAGITGDVFWTGPLLEAVATGTVSLRPCG